LSDIFYYEHPFVCTDAVVFTIKTDEPDSYRKLPQTHLRVLLYKRDAEPFRGTWSLPGGFLDINELPEDNIRRKLSVKTEIDGIEKLFLEQLFTFCDIERDPRTRVISIAYLGLMNESESQGKAAWFDVREIDKADLAFDHCKIIEMALLRLQSKILYTDIIFNLLPEQFTLTQLQNVYEAILGYKEQAANFRRKINHMVQETEYFTSDKGHRPAKLYKKAGSLK